MKVTDLKLNEKNPRKITKKKFAELKESISTDPQFMPLKPLIYDKKMIIIAGNQRYKAIIELGYDEIPDEWTKSAEKLTAKQRKKFILLDNLSYGEFDTDVVEEEYGFEVVEEWNYDIKKPEKLNAEDGAIEFSKELDDVSNYIVLKFDTDIDWLNIQTLLDLGSTYSKRQNGKPWSKGVGRVVDGAKAIEIIKNS